MPEIYFWTKSKFATTIKKAQLGDMRNSESCIRKIEKLNEQSGLYAKSKGAKENNCERHGKRTSPFHSRRPW